MDCCQLLQALGHDGCVALVVVGLLVLAFSVLVLSMLAFNVAKVWSDERRKLADEATTRQRLEHRAAIVAQLRAEGKDTEEAQDWLRQLG
jgi:membrane-bound ClpP family serine protease